MHCDGILFDLDGTLWDATASLANIWRSALAGEPDIPAPPTQAQLQGVMGMTAPQLMATLFPHLSPQRAAQLFDQVSRVENDYILQHGGTLYPGLMQMLSTLSSRFPLFIVSNCGPEYIPCFLQAHQLEDYFTDWECIGRSGKAKWENIRLVAQRNGLHAPIYIGDTHLDKQAAEKAGVPFIHAAYGFGQLSGVQAIACPLDLIKLLD